MTRTPRINIENSGFYQQFEVAWSSRGGEDAPGAGQRKAECDGIETLNSGYLFGAENKLALYGLSAAYFMNRRLKLWQMKKQNW